MGVQFGGGNPLYVVSTLCFRNDFFLLKVREVDGQTATRIFIFDENGNAKLDQGFFEVPGTIKYEGAAFYG